MISGKYCYLKVKFTNPWCKTMTVNSFAQGYKWAKKNRFYFANSNKPISDHWTDVLTEPIKISSEHSCFKRHRGYALNQDESLASFFSRINPSSVEITLVEPRGTKSNRPGLPDTIKVKA